MFMVQGLLKAVGRYLVEQQFRKHINVEYVNHHFCNFRNEITDIPVHPELSVYYPNVPTPFKWMDHMNDDKNPQLHVSNTKRLVG
jgi:hypothetical protein